MWQFAARLFRNTELLSLNECSFFVVSALYIDSSWRTRGQEA